MESKSAIYITILSVLFVSVANLNVTDEIVETVTKTKILTSPITKTVDKDSLTKTEGNQDCSVQTIDLTKCPSEIECDKLGNECLKCSCDLNCRFGHDSWALCQAPSELNCIGSRTFQRKFKCSYCYFSDKSLVQCDEKFGCESVTDPQDRFHVAACNVSSSVLCFGKRSFTKQQECNWTGGHRWLTTLILSITLGGFGADRYKNLNTI